MYQPERATITETVERSLQWQCEIVYLFFSLLKRASRSSKSVDPFESVLLLSFGTSGRPRSTENGLSTDYLGKHIYSRYEGNKPALPALG